MFVARRGQCRGRRWPKRGDRWVWVKQAEDFWPAVKKLQREGFEMELWVGGCWRNCLTRQWAKFPNYTLVHASDWRVRPGDSKTIETDVFELLEWRESKWARVPAQPPQGSDPWEMTSMSRMVLIGFRGD